LLTLSNTDGHHEFDLYMFRAGVKPAFGAFASVSDPCCVPFERFRFIYLLPIFRHSRFVQFFYFCCLDRFFAAFMQVCFLSSLRLKFRIIAQPNAFLIRNSLYFNSFLSKFVVIPCSIYSNQLSIDI
jgi:hypothetical protein